MAWLALRDKATAAGPDPQYAMAIAAAIRSGFRMGQLIG